MPPALRKKKEGAFLKGVTPIEKVTEREDDYVFVRSNNFRVI